jgi:micrococcal nuclease
MPTCGKPLLRGALHGLAPFVLLLGCLPLQAQTVGSGVRVYEARVTRVFDGDTLWVKPVTGGSYRKLRLDGLDAPEICQSGGTASRDALAARVLQQVVTVHERSRDDYGRALVRLTHAGDDVGAVLVLQGHAWSYRWRYSQGPYAVQEQKARTQNMGLFADKAAEVPRDFRRRHGPCPLPAR